MPDPSTDLIPIQRLGLGVLVVYGAFWTMFFTAVLWINATTGEPVVFDAYRYGEGMLELAILSAIAGGSCYGLVVFDWMLRGGRGSDGDEDP